MNAEEREYLLGSAAMRLARNDRVYQALFNGVPVPRSRLKANVLVAIEEPIDGPPIELDELLALRVESALGVVDEEAPAPVSDQPEPVSGETGKQKRADQTQAGIDWQQLSEVEMHSIVFADKPLLQQSAFHLVVGRKGQGKGTLLTGWAAQVTRGELGDKPNVVWIGSEDSAAIDIKPRLLAAGGDDKRVYVVKEGWIQLPRDIEEIRRAMTEFGDVGMLVIDPVGNHITGKDSNSDTDIRDALAPLNALADELECMTFGVRHLSEKECSKGVLAAILGASAWVHLPRVVLAIAKDDEDPNISHVQCVIGNRLPPETSGRMFRIDGVLLDGLENEVTKAVWLGDSNKNVEDMLTAVGKREPSKSRAARELILNILERDGEQESDALDARVAKETGLAAKTVRNIRSELGKDGSGLIKSIPEKDEYGSFQRWLVGRTQAPREDAE